MPPRRGFPPVPIVLLFFLLTSTAALNAGDGDFGIRVEGGGRYCTGDIVPVDVFADANLSGNNIETVHGFSLAVCHLPYQLEIVSADPGVDLLEEQDGPDLHFQQITTVPRGVIQAVIVDPEGVRSLPPVNNIHALSLAYRVRDASAPARIVPCNRTLNNPPLIISFSTGSKSYYPPDSQFKGIEITSPCTPAERTFLVDALLEKPLSVDCNTLSGTTGLSILLQEQPVACCPAKLIQGLSLALQFPPELTITRCGEGDVRIADISVRERNDLFQIDLLYLNPPRFDTEKTALKIELTQRAGSEIKANGQTKKHITFSPTGIDSLDTGLRDVNGTMHGIDNSATKIIEVPVNAACLHFLRGDVNTDGRSNIADCIALLQFLFNSSPRETPACMDAADANDNGMIDISDCVFLLAHIFNEGTHFPLPNSVCGSDPTGDRLGCTSFSECDQQ